ncbi:MAG: aminoglycoside phosphotransferase family protein [Alphaproteobacteria bacterium]|nr:aminoglycoside phosphotransferase family protein [Alphaproteobacteria bacterium]
MTAAVAPPSVRSPAPFPERAELERALVGMGLLGLGEHPVFEKLTGGVSSDIWRVELTRGPACIKRAVPRLRVKADWRVPVERTNYECGWMKVAARTVPNAVPAIWGQDETAGLFVMAFFDPATHPLWKEQLHAGIANPSTAAAVGETIGRIHAATADDAAIAAAFDTTYIFLPLRLEAYLLATARAHPDLATTIESVVETTRTTRRTLVHGDVSPKNILVGPDGPVFLDAEGAWFGDPAFDAAFCLNHLLLKCVWTPAWTASFLSCFDAFARGYFAQCSWEPAAKLEKRIARLLPGLFLARVDGKSPVEYITTDTDRDRVRRTARLLLANPTDQLGDIRAAWASELHSSR